MYTQYKSYPKIRPSCICKFGSPATIHPGDGLFV